MFSNECVQRLQKAQQGRRLFQIGLNLLEQRLEKNRRL